MQKRFMPSRRTFIEGAALVGAASLIAPSSAFGVSAAEKQAEADAVRNQLVGLQADLESAEIAYHDAVDEQEAAQQAMEAEQVKIDEASNQISYLQNKLGDRARSMYRSGSSTFLDFLLGAASFAEFTQNWDILDRVNSEDTAMVADTKTLREDLNVAKEEYAHQEMIAEEKAAEAESIRAQSEAKVSEATTLMNSLDTEAQELLAQEQAAAAAAAAAVAAAAAAQQARQNPSGNTRNDTTDDNSGGGATDDNGGYTDDNGGYTDDNSGGGATVDVPSYGSVVDYALSRVGCPYEWGATGPDSFDCSGLVVWAYAQIGINIGRSSEALYAQASQVVSLSEARPGDVLYRYGHVGIAIAYGGYPYVHAPTPGQTVCTQSSPSWSNFTCALRFG